VLTTAYVVGMGVTFATLGVVAAMAGKAFGTALGNPYAVYFNPGAMVDAHGTVMTGAAPAA